MNTASHIIPPTNGFIFQIKFNAFFCFDFFLNSGKSFHFLKKSPAVEEDGGRLAFRLRRGLPGPDPEEPHQAREGDPGVHQPPSRRPRLRAARTLMHAGERGHHGGQGHRPVRSARDQEDGHHGARAVAVAFTIQVIFSIAEFHFTFSLSQ